MKLFITHLSLSSCHFQFIRFKYRHSDTPRLKKFLTYTVLKQKKIEITFLKSAPNFSLRKRKLGDTKIEEEYSWAITQTAELSRCDRSGSSVLGVLDVSHIHLYIDHIYTPFRRATEIPEPRCRRPCAWFSALSSATATRAVDHILFNQTILKLGLGRAITIL